MANQITIKGEASETLSRNFEGYLWKSDQITIKGEASETLSGNFEGYLWKSDQNPHEVEVFQGKAATEISLCPTDNPFIIEGQLYDKDQQKSYSIKYMDGTYYLTEYNLTDLKGEKEKHQYIAAFDDAPGLLCFEEVWREDEVLREQKDNLCLGMKQLYPAEFVFVGFKKEEGGKS